MKKTLNFSSWTQNFNFITLFILGFRDIQQYEVKWTFLSVKNSVICEEVMWSTDEIPGKLNLMPIIQASN
jgi:hypothetical protein